MNQESSAVLISIHKKYSDKIFEGTKKFEFRKNKLGKNTKRIYVYESKSDIKDKLIGYFLTDENIKKIPLTEILNYIKKHPKESGIDYETAKEYYRGYEYGYMYPILKINKFRIDQKDIFGKDFKPPQNFRYIKKNDEEKIIQKIITGNNLKNIFNKYSTKEFPNLKQDLDSSNNQYYSNQFGYTVVNKEKNKIVRIEKFNKKYSSNLLIDLSLKNLDINKEIYINVPANRQKLIDTLILKGFEIDKIFNSKYVGNDKILKLVKKCN